MRGEHDQTVLCFHREGESEPKVIPARDSKRRGGGIDHFLECIKTNRKPLTDGEEGVKVLRVLEAAQKSLDQKGVPVPVTQHS